MRTRSMAMTVLLGMSAAIAVAAACNSSDSPGDSSGALGAAGTDAAGGQGGSAGAGGIGGYGGAGGTWPDSGVCGTASLIYGVGGNGPVEGAACSSVGAWCPFCVTDCAPFGGTGWGGSGWMRYSGCGCVRELDGDPVWRCCAEWTSPPAEPAPASIDVCRVVRADGPMGCLPGAACSNADASDPTCQPADGGCGWQCSCLPWWYPYHSASYYACRSTCGEGCPATAPAVGSDCPGIGVACEYAGSGTVLCNGVTWEASTLSWGSASDAGSDGDGGDADADSDGGDAAGE